jgi:hypothetical protein
VRLPWLWIFALSVLLTGCATDKMRSFIGQDIRNVVLAYGPPTNQVDLGGNARAYQWNKVSVSTTPVNAVSTTSKDKKGKKTTTTQYTGGDQSSETCIYTFITSFNPSLNAWIVTNIREPSFSCSIGDIG